jgi:hypothetical protein
MIALGLIGKFPVNLSIVDKVQSGIGSAGANAFSKASADANAADNLIRNL